MNGNDIRVLNIPRLCVSVRDANGAGSCGSVIGVL